MTHFQGLQPNLPDPHGIDSLPAESAVQPAHAEKLRRQLSALEFAKRVEDMNAPGWRLHPLKGALRGFHSVTVSGNWRVTFRFQNTDAILVDYLDYH